MKKGSSGKSVLGLVNPQNPEFEELLVSVAVRLPFERLDLVVGSFHGSGGYGMVVPSKDAHVGISSFWLAEFGSQDPEKLG